MQFIFDNLAATLIAGVLFLILVAVNHRSRMSALESSSYYALKQQELSFVEMVKRDMQNVTVLYSIVEDPSTMEFRFDARTDPTDTASHSVVYRRVFYKYNEGQNLYRIERLVDGVSSGGSTSTLIAWAVVAQNEEGVKVSDVADARQIFVSFEALSPYQKGETIDKSRWEATFRPPLLQQATSI